MSTPSPEPRATLRRLLDGFQVTQAVHVAAVLGVADLLAEGPRTSAELAEATGADARSLYRLLRALAALGVLTEHPGPAFELTPVGDQLRSDVPGSLRNWAIFIGNPALWQSWSELEHSIRTGESAFEHLFGEDVWSFRARHPEQSAIFAAAMAGNTAALEAALIDAYDFGRFRRVVDVGGSRGVLLGALLAAHPRLEGTVFDLPHVVAEAEPQFHALGVAERAEAVGGSFFESVPAGGDAYLLKSIIHDWDDAEAAAILRSCAAVLPAEGVVLVVEHDLGEPNENPTAKLSDLNMLVAPGGLERTRDEYAALFETAGLRLTDVVPVRGGWAIYEARL